jgi:hypothetical protein
MLLMQVMEIRDAIREDRSCQVTTNAMRPTPLSLQQH